MFAGLYAKAFHSSHMKDRQTQNQRGWPFWTWRVNTQGKRQKGYRVPTKNHHVNTFHTHSLEQKGASVEKAFWNQNHPPYIYMYNRPPLTDPTQNHHHYMCTIVALGSGSCAVVRGLFCFIVIFMPVVLFWHFWQILVPHPSHSSMANGMLLYFVCFPAGLIALVSVGISIILVIYRDLLY